MSFFNTIRGLGRTSKKNRKDAEVNSQSLYQGGHPESPTKLSSSPTRVSNTRQQRYVPKSYPYAFHGSSSPTKASRSSLANSPEKKNHERPLFLCEPFVKTSLVKGSFKTIVQLPKYVDYGEWLALNIFEMYNHLNQFYGIFFEYVTPQQYPSMNAGPDTTYLWVDSNNASVNLPASQYIDYVLSWISSKINDQSVFPTKSGGAFPPTFLKDCKNISRQLFRIFAFIYFNLFDKIIHLSLEAHWNSFFSHFISFVKEFSLVNRNEFAPLLPLIENFEAQGKIIE